MLAGSESVSFKELNSELHMLKIRLHFVKQFFKRIVFIITLLKISRHASANDIDKKRILNDAYYRPYVGISAEKYFDGGNNTVNYK